MFLQNSLFRTLVLGLFATVLFVQCADSDEYAYLADQPTNAFIELVKSDVAPFNSLSQEAVLHFNSKVVFEDGEFLGADHRKVAEELSEAELQSFFSQLVGQEVAIVDEVPEVEEGTVESRGCVVFIVSGKYPILEDSNGNARFCINTWGVCRLCLNIPPHEQ